LSWAIEDYLVFRSYFWAVSAVMYYTTLIALFLPKKEI
jgi:hypothetical protein